MMVKKSMTAGAVAAAALAAVLTAPGTAGAAGQDVSEQKNYLSASACSGNEFKFTFRFNSNQGGAYRKLGYAHGNLAATEIQWGVDPTTQPLRYCDGTGAGSGQGIKNNAASITNSHTSYGGTVYYNSWWQGAYDSVQPARPTPASRNLSNTYNQNASFKWS
ncbi:hypothetical protein ACIBTP_35505 [Streptomyces avidinii]|uniref:hypothetical protein n=1 Tax=Streptomyces avidinii TaxID=1895 RepID=UPI0037BE1788